MVVGTRLPILHRAFAKQAFQENSNLLERAVEPLLSILGVAQP